jgi:hypothetical protein
MALLGCAAVLGVLVAAAAPAAALRHPLYCGANNLTRIPALDSKYAALQPALEQVQVCVHVRVPSLARSSALWHLGVARVLRSFL